MDFIKYPHLERFGTDEVDGITIGKCHIFPKIDGTNASVWRAAGDRMGCGSRNRQLSVDDDNAGFMNWAVKQDNLHAFINAYPDLVLYGEWLVPHSLKTYRDDAWRKFYVFDVFNRDTGFFVHYDDYSAMLALAGIEFIPCTLVATNPDYELLSKARDLNTFLLQEGKGAGEGIVIKQYGWQNRFGRTTWAKLITNTFKEEHVKEMGGSVVALKLLEEEIADEFITDHMVNKIVAKIRAANGETGEGTFGARDIPRLLGMAYHDLVVEELWEAVKKHKNPKIDFRTLNHCATARVKKLMPELFGGKA